MILPSVLRKTTKSSIIKKLSWLIPLIWLESVSFMKFIKIVSLNIFNCSNHSICISHMCLSSPIQLGIYIIDLEKCLLVVIIWDICRSATHHYGVISTSWLYALSSCTSIFPTYRMDSKHASRSLTSATFHLFVLDHLISFDSPSQSAFSSWSIMTSRCLYFSSSLVETALI